MTSDSEQLRSQLDRAEREIAELRERVKGLENVMRPFASYSGEDDRRVAPGILYEMTGDGRFCLPDGHGFHICWSDPADLPVNFTAGQFRRARAELNKEKSNG